MPGRLNGFPFAALYADKYLLSATANSGQVVSEPVPAKPSPVVPIRVMRRPRPRRQMSWGCYDYCVVAVPVAVAAVADDGAAGKLDRHYCKYDCDYELFHGYYSFSYLFVSICVSIELRQ